jgi:hypothetical protein
MHKVSEAVREITTRRVSAARQWVREILDAGTVDEICRGIKF